MRIPGSNRFFLNPCEKKSLDRMARNGERVYDVEEGFSDGDSSVSLEEISAEDVRKDGRRSRSRVWKDGITGYTIASSFGSNLYSFAWAQAVQNKPLGLEMNSAWDADLEAEKKGCDDVVIGDVRDDPALNVEMEKEEGELEEGEIDLGSESVEEEQINVSSSTVEDDSKKSESEIKESEGKEEADMEDLDRRIGEILEELDMITLEEAEASFEDVCSRLLKSFAGLRAIYVETNFPILDAPVQQAFIGIKTLNSVLCSGNLQKSKQNTDLLLRLLIHIKNQYSMLLSQEQVTEIDTMAQNLVSNDISREKALQSGSFGPGDGGVCLLGMETSPFPKNRVEFCPLLDLHVDYDEGSLPSPTRENTQPLLIPNPISFGASLLLDPTVCKKEEDEGTTLHSYETDALKAFSSYQQKYGRSSVLPSNQLPSPTPSEECDHEEDKNDEVSSFLAFGNAGVGMDICSSKAVSSSSTDILSGTLSSPPKMVGLMTSQPNCVAKAKNRDPRLRLINHNASVVSDHSLSTNGYVEGQAYSKRQRAAEDPAMDDLPSKRQGKSSLILKDIPVNVRSETSNNLLSNEYAEIGSRKPEIGAANADTSPDSDSTSNHNDSNEQSATAGSAQSVLLPSLLKDMGVNPAMLMELLRMEQQRLSVESQQKTGNSSINNPEVKAPEVGKHQSTMPQVHAQSPSLDTQGDAGRIRMKARDPRRILHNNMVPKARASEPEETKMGAIARDVQYKERLIIRDSVEQAQTNTVPTSWQFTRNIKSSTDGMPGSKLTSAPQSGPSMSSQPIPSLASKQDGRPLGVEPNDCKAVNGSTSVAAVTSGFSHSASAWGDVDHLLDGYDEQQKAAIQKERARRIAEQSKMFAARKLCLVLDLDHTLLNSAKFGEVDQVHEEILRIKEEQDREKSQRHLYRFQHMGMWTKLRPGVWNFLEKASKFYELHLYTMGNKLYATEMAKVLDPSGTLFAGRVISKGDDGDLLDGDERVPKSKDLDGVLGLESAVVIIDDSVRVWPHNKHNLIAVERYTYFPCSRRQFGLLGPSLLEIDHDERPEDGTLASCLAVIERLHQIFFSHRVLNDVDVRHILASEQRKILAGCRIVFSRVFPVGEANPHLHPLWQTAEQFGAVCTNQIDEQVTHVVANSLGTDKVNWALCTGRFVVHPGWVEASALLYRRANENDFAVKL